MWLTVACVCVCVCVAQAELLISLEVGREKAEKLGMVEEMRASWIFTCISGYCEISEEQPRIHSEGKRDLPFGEHRKVTFLRLISFSLSC